MSRLILGLVRNGFREHGLKMWTFFLRMKVKKNWWVVTIISSQKYWPTYICMYAYLAKLINSEKAALQKCILEAFWEHLWASSRMAHGLTEFHSFNGNMHNAIPLLLPAEHLQWAFSHSTESPYEHAQIWQGPFVLNTMLVDIKLGQAVNIHSLSHISFQHRWAKPVLSDSLQFKDYISFQNQE